MSVKIISKIVKIFSLIVFTKPLIIAPKYFFYEIFLKERFDFIKANFPFLNYL